MGQILEHRIKQSTFESPRQEALLNLLVTSHFIRHKVDQVCSRHGITHSQYNVLRILKGAQPNGYPRFEIIDRMLEPSPDVTRLIDRLVKNGLAERIPSADNKRLSITKITSKGMTKLKKMEPDIFDLDNKSLFQNLSNDECRKLSALCEKIYG